MDFREYVKSHVTDLLGGARKRTPLLDLLEAKYRSAAGEVLRPGEILVEAESMEKAFELASEKLKTDLSKLSYRILKQGQGGFLGVNKQAFQIAFAPYQSKTRKTNKDAGGSDLEFDDFSPEVLPANRDGSIELRVTRQGKFLVVEGPLGSGGAIDFTKANSYLLSKKVEGVDPDLLRTLVRKKDGKPFKIGEWLPNPKNDGKVFFEVSDDRMKGFMRIVAPKADGRFPDEEDVNNLVAENLVAFGLDRAKLLNALEKKIVNIPVLIAQGRPVEHGKDAYIDYKIQFPDPHKNINLVDGEDVDLHELGLIVTVMADEILAEKIPFTLGAEGMNILGQIIPPKEGKDIELKGGENTELTGDGKVLKAKVNGHVVKEKDLLAVYPVFTVSGDVGPQTGHITNMGSVVVTGNVLDGFNIKAGGTIEVKGSVGGSVIEATGDITIRLGVAGRNQGRILSADGNVLAKFLQDIHVTAGKDVIVNESIMNCHVNAKSSVILIGKKAGIVGGVIRAFKEIKARTLGSTSYTRTVLQVGVPPEIREGYEMISKRVEENTPLLANTKLDVTTLKSQHLDEAKQKTLAELEAKVVSLEDSLEEDKNHLVQLTDIIATSPVKGRVVFAKSLYSGVVITCNTATQETKRDQSSTSEILVDPNNPEILKYNAIKMGKSILTL